MRKLQKWTWGKATPKFVGYCPFFWFTWLCLLLTPVTLVFKTVVFLFRLVFSAIPETFWITRPPDSILVIFYEVYLDGGSIKHVYDNWTGFDYVLKWVAITPDWENCIKAIIAKQLKKAEKEAVAEPKRARLANRMSRYSSYIVKPILATAIIFVLYILLPKVWQGAVLLWQVILSVSWADLLVMIKGAGIFGAAILILWAFIYFLTRFIEGLRRCPKCPEKIGWSYRTGLALGSGVEFLFETIAALYTSECPLIEWDDHSEPIQRR